MTSGRWARLLFLVVPLLMIFGTGCGDFWQAPSTTTTGTTGTTTLSSGVFYVLNQETAQVVAFSINSGTLTTIGTYTLPSPEPLAMAISPNGNFLYVSTLGGGIYLYAVSSTGALTLGNDSVAISLDPATTMQVDATNSWLVDAVSGVGQLNAIALNTTTGGLASAAEREQVFALPASTVEQLAISPNDSTTCADCYVFVAMGTGGTEEIHFNPGNADPFGGAGNTPVLNSGGSANAVAVDPTNRLFYVGESDALPSASNSGGLRALVIGASTITENSGSPYTSGGTGPSEILAQSGYVYVSNKSGTADGNIASYTLTASGTTTAPVYTFTDNGTISTGVDPLGLAVDSKGNFLLAVNAGGSPDLDGYTMDAGILTTVLSSTTGTDPVQAIAIVATP